MTESELLLKLLSFDTQNSDDLNEVKTTDKALDFVASILYDEGIRCEFQEYYLGVNQIKRKNLIASFKDNEHLPKIGLEGHIDTVPFGDYKCNPLGERREGKIYGRGAVDMKGSLAGMISSMIKSKNLFNSLKVNPVLIITSDEEANKFAGIKNYLLRKPELDFLICGEPSDFIVEDRFKGALYCKIEIIGKSGHGSRQHEGENAIIKGIPTLKELEKLYFEIQKFDNELFISSDPYSHVSSMNPGIIIAGNKVNIIPDKMRIEFEMRLVRPFQEYREIIVQRIDQEVEFVFGIDPIIADLSSEFVQKKVNILGCERGVGVGFSEANLINQRGIPSIVYGVGKKSMSHTNEEYIEENELKKYTLNLVNLLI